MQRREAISLLREICDWPEAMLIDCVFLKPLNNVSNSCSEAYELYIKNSFTESSLKRMKSLVKKHELKMKESDGYLIIYAPERELLTAAA